MLEGALAAGLAACGVDVFLAGVIPTPAIPFLIKDERASIGAVISASHNPPEDNGIKFFSARGMKLAVEDELAIEKALEEASTGCRDVGTIVPMEAAASRYAAFLVGTIETEDIDLSETTIVTDCAYGATGGIAPRVLRHFNAKIIELNTAPDGRRINQGCGSTHLSPLCDCVIEHRADLGVAFDGDGDRVLLVSRDGKSIDGDQMMGIFALDMKREERLDPPLLVATVMSNLGLEQALASQSIELVRTPVGDRNVAQAMLARGARIGGEQSGHIILSDHSVTGDGILTVVKLLEIAHKRRKTLQQLAQEIPRHPQIRCDVPCDSPAEALGCPELQDAIKKARSALGNGGRLVVRASGTQPVIRIMVEAQSEALCRQVSEGLERQIRNIQA